MLFTTTVLDRTNHDWIDQPHCGWGTCFPGCLSTVLGHAGNAQPLRVAPPIILARRGSKHSQSDQQNLHVERVNSLAAPINAIIPYGRCCTATTIQKLNTVATSPPKLSEAMRRVG